MPYKCIACNKNFRYKVSLKSHKCPVTNSDLKHENEKDEELVHSSNNEIDQEKKLLDSSELGCSEIHKKCILVSRNPHIEISYNAADLKSVNQEEIEKITALNEQISIYKKPGQFSIMIYNKIYCVIVKL